MQRDGRSRELHINMKTGEFITGTITGRARRSIR